MPPARRWLAMAGVMTGTTMAVLDASITNVALPTISRALAVSPEGAIWVANAYQLSLAACIIGFAALGDVVGYRRIYLSGLVLFTLASLGCATSPTLQALILARILQGLGASAMMSVGPALYRTIFPSKELGKALGFSALTVAASSAAGPTLGGLILSVADWPWLFAVNLPLGILAIAIGHKAMPPNQGRGGRFDLAAALLAALAMGCLVIGLDGLSRPGQPGLLIAVWLVAILSIVAFLRRQASGPLPALLPLDLFASGRFSLAALTSTCSFVAQGLTFVALPFLLQGDFGFSPLVSGLLFTPWPLTIVIAAPLAGRLSDRIDPRKLSTLGLAVLALGLSCLALLPDPASPLDIVWRASLCGLGFGFFQSPNNRELLGLVPRRLSGAASGVLASARTFGQSVGAALAAVMIAVPHPHLADGMPSIPAGRIAAALWIASIAAAMAAGVSLGRIRIGTQK